MSRSEQRNDKTYKGIGKHSPVHKKKYLTETILEGVQTLEILVKDVKSIVLTMFNELKETIGRKSKINQKK